MSGIPIGDPRKAGEEGPAGDQREGGEEGPAGDPRQGGEATVKGSSKASDTSDTPAKKASKAKG